MSHISSWKKDKCFTKPFCCITVSKSLWGRKGIPRTPWEGNRWGRLDKASWSSGWHIWNVMLYLHCWSGKICEFVFSKANLSFPCPMLILLCAHHSPAYSIKHSIGTNLVFYLFWFLSFMEGSVLVIVISHHVLWSCVISICEALS